MNSTLYSYLETALWSSCRCDEEGNDLGPYDDEYAPEDVLQEDMDGSWQDLSGFIEHARELGLLDGHDDEQVAHDFWLTRNGHGAGFWDGDYEHGDELTKLAKAYGSVDLYEAGDGKVGMQ